VVLGDRRHRLAAVWVLFEGGFGGTALCSLIVTTRPASSTSRARDHEEAARGELEVTGASQKLPWIEVRRARAVGAVAEALALQARLGTSPPAAFDRWKSVFESAPWPPLKLGPRHGPQTPHGGSQRVDLTLAERATELLALPEPLRGSSIPNPLQSDSLALLEARASRLVVSDQIKGEREASM